MAYKRILTVQDISCVGQCSMTVALPILSVCGHEACILPTAVLSTHTGGFGKPAVAHLDDAAEPFWQHWQENGITFDAVLVGYIGNIRGIRTVREIADHLLAPGGLLIVDPAFGDHGRIYSGLSDAYVAEMTALSSRADILLPNFTEAALFAGMPYRDAPGEAYVNRVLETLPNAQVVLTGIGYREGETGAVLRQNGQQIHYAHKKLGKSYHGTGDMFAACFTGALLQGRPAEEAVQIAADFVCRCIENTMASPAHWYGVKFETALPYLMWRLGLQPGL